MPSLEPSSMPSLMPTSNPSLEPSSMTSSTSSMMPFSWLHDHSHLSPPLRHYYSRLKKLTL
eukprot:11901109-Ditylum_brightwellii.AAC.1